MTTREVAELAGSTVHTVLRAIADGALAPSGRSGENGTPWVIDRGAALGWVRQRATSAPRVNFDIPGPAARDSWTPARSKARLTEAEIAARGCRL